MVYSQDELNDNEKIVLNLRPHWWFFSVEIILVVISLIVGLVVLAFNIGSNITGLAFIPFILACLWLAWKYVVWRTTRFVVTTDRLINRSGVLNRQGIEIPLERVNTVFFSQTLFERLIGSGDLEIESAGEQGRQSFSNIRRPLKVQNEIYRQMESNENRKFEAIGSGEFGSEDIPSQIEKLDQLRRRNIITAQEFEQKKGQLLDRM